MKTDTTTMARPSQAQEADATERATSDHAKTENLAMFAGLSDAANDTHIEEHIQGMVAVTMGHLSADAPATTRANAEHWQDWALGVANGVVQTVPATV